MCFFFFHFLKIVKKLIIVHEFVVDFLNRELVEFVIQSTHRCEGIFIMALFGHCGVHLRFQFLNHEAVVTKFGSFVGYAQCCYRLGVFCFVERFSAFLANHFHVIIHPQMSLPYCYFLYKFRSYLYIIYHRDVIQHGSNDQQ